MRVPQESAAGESRRRVIMAPMIDDHGVMIVDRINPPSIFVFRLLRCLQFTSHSRNPYNHRRLNGTTTSFQTTKALLLLHTPLGVLIF